MQAAIEKAGVLLEAHSWIRQFRDKIVVIKLGGSVMQEEILESALHDIVFMATVGLHPVIVHGGGPSINDAMEEAGIVPQFIQGRRYTDADTLAIVEDVLAGSVNNNIADKIEELGGRAMTLNFKSTPVLIGEKISLLDETGSDIDLGSVGTVLHVDTSVIENLCYAEQIPVIPSMCLNEQGDKFNVNADSAATAVAQALRAEKLVFLSDIPGVLQDKNDPDSLIHTLTVDQANDAITEGIIGEGMLPKVEACLETIGSGVNKVHIIDGRVKHSLLLEIYTDVGIGTEIISNETTNG
ncbi:MAG: acetylglutamate kinase [Pirellulaceae bacterium]|nr:acetylglutamate kinase [Pirellulaceae bacterium]